MKKATPGRFDPEIFNQWSFWLLRAIEVCLQFFFAQIVSVWSLDLSKSIKGKSKDMMSKNAVEMELSGGRTISKGTWYSQCMKLAKESYLTSTLRMNQEMFVTYRVCKTMHYGICSAEKVVEEHWYQLRIMPINSNLQGGGFELFAYKRGHIIC